MVFVRSRFFRFLFLLLIIAVFGVILIFRFCFYTKSPRSDTGLNENNPPYVVISRSAPASVRTNRHHFIFHAGKNSPGGDIARQMHNTTQLSIEDLMTECERTLGCVGFTPDGVLKQFILPYNKWTNRAHGIYTLDSNYCELKEVRSCRPGTTCLYNLNHTYSCIPEPSTTSKIHIVVSVDLAELDGLVAMIQSVIEHTNGKDNTVIHIVVNSTNRQPIENKLTCSLNIPQKVQLEFVSFDLSENFKELISVREKALTYLTSQANFARFYFGQLFPDLSHVLYLDVDIIVQHDIGVLWREVINTTALATVVTRTTRPCSKMFAKRATSLYRKRSGKNLTEMICPNFIAGVVGFNLDKWRKNKVMDEVEYWMGENSKSSLWGLGTQPILHIVVLDDYKAVDGRWHVADLGHMKVSMTKVKNGYILHWNGFVKPWGKSMGKEPSASRRKLTEGYLPFWRKYYKEECNKKGKCVFDATKGIAHCVCDSGYKGIHCTDH